MKSFLYLVIILIIPLSSISGQDPFYINYTIDDGLPSNEVYDVEIDDDGLIWFTTDRGISSYDSYEFTNYTTFDGLCDNVNFEIFKDSEGVLWFFGYNGKVTLYENGVFRPYRYNKKLKDLTTSIYGTYVKEIQQTKENTLLVAHSSQKGACLIELSMNEDPKLHCDSNSSELVTIDKSVFSFTRNFRNIHSLHPISYNIDDHPHVSEIGMRSNTNFLYKKNKKLWFSDPLNNGLQTYDLSTKKRDTILQNYAITDIKSDERNNYWISTTTGGIIYISNMHVKVLDTNSGLNSTKGNYLKFHEFANQLFCGANDYKVLVIDTNNRIKALSLFNSTVAAMNIDQFQTINNGKTLIFTGHEMEVSNNSYQLIKSKFTRRIVYFSNGDIGLKSLNTLKIYSNSELSDTIEIKLDEKATKVIEGNNSEIWIGTLGELYKIENFEYYKYKEIKVNTNEKTGRVSDITIDSLNNVWVSTIGNGIFLINDRDTIQFNTSNGLTTNIVNTVEVIDTNQIWVGTNNGLNLLYYNDTTNSIKFVESFDQSDGLNTSYINDIIEWNDKIYIASPNGICVFPSDKIRKVNTEIPLNINSTYVNDSLILLENLKKLNYDQNQITIKYRAIRHGKIESQKLYRYKLERNEIKRDWIYTNDTEAIYDNLQHGAYTFEVSACKKYGEWNPNTQKLSFTIRPHYSDTNWFKTLLFLGSTLVLFLIFLYFFRKYQKTKATELELVEVKRKAKEAELSALRNQMNPHFIFNSLNTIQNFIFKKDVTKANILLSKFSSLIRRSLNYSRLESINLRDEIKFLEDYVELEKVRFPELITMKFHISNRLDYDFTNIPSLLLQPLVENAIKHGISKSKLPGIISITISPLEDSYLKVTVANARKKANKIQTTNIGHISLGHQIIKDRMQILRDNGFPNTMFKIDEKLNLNNQIYQVTLILPKL